MKIAVIGGLGYIGRVVCEFLKDHDVDVLDLKQEDFACGYNEASHEDYDVMIWLAGKCYVEDSVQQAMQYYEANIYDLMRMFEDFTFKKLVFASSCTAAYPESSPYAFSKHVMERIIEDTLENYCIIRYFNVFGSHECFDGRFLHENHDPETHLKPLLERATENNPVTIRGDCVRKYQNVSIIAEQTALAATENITGKYDASGGYVSSNFDEAKDCKHVIYQNDLRPGDVKEIRGHLDTFPLGGLKWTL